MELPRTPSLRLDGRRALVTGAGRGIGLAAAAALSEAGAEVVLAARSGIEIEEAAEAIRARGGRAEALALDVTEVEETAERIAAAGPFDALANNAGTNRPAAFQDVTFEDFHAVLALNLSGAFFAAQAVARGMIAAGKRGAIVHMSSQMGHVGGARRSVCCASKWAIEGMARAMAIDLAPHGIRVNTLCSTFIETPLTRPFLADEGFRAQVLQKISLGRVGQVEDLMGPLVFLCSDAAALMTGSSLLVDGGWTAG